MSEPNDSTAELPCSESSLQSVPTQSPDNSFPVSSNYTAYNPTTIWWPHPSAFDDLTVEETETGFEFSAPDGTECAAWLEYFMETPERHAAWEAEILASLSAYLHHLENGQTQGLSDQQTADYPGGEKDGSGPL